MKTLQSTDSGRSHFWSVQIGKSRFAEALKISLPNARILGTERLGAMGPNPGLGIWSNNLAQ